MIVPAVLRSIGPLSRRVIVFLHQQMSGSTDGDGERCGNGSLPDMGHYRFEDHAKISSVACWRGCSTLPRVLSALKPCDVTNRRTVHVHRDHSDQGGAGRRSKWCRSVSTPPMPRSPRSSGPITITASSFSVTNTSRRHNRSPSRAASARSNSTSLANDEACQEIPRLWWSPTSPKTADRSASVALARTGTATCATPPGHHAGPCSTRSKSPTCMAYRWVIPSLPVPLRPGTRCARRSGTASTAAA
jgi:hypothetical protein